ncbi:beta-galactosidase trimerization domain-containing protein [Paenibacillus macerans]|uniref:beta-galactosidase trimerization domain-containing protein n=1 Tax=Paenibacillus macerans TaxID=44252 RepID=UPI003D321431
MRRYIPFTYKMLIPYLLLVLLTDAIIGYVSYSMLIQSRTEMAETNIRTGMEQARNNIRYQMDEIQRMSDTLFSNLAFQRALQTKGEPYDIYLVMLDEIVPQITAPLKLFGNDIRLMLYTLNSDLYIVSGDNLEEPIKDSDYYILPFEDIKDSGWCREFKDSERDNVWLQIDTDKRLRNISLIRRLISYSGTMAVIGYVRITEGSKVLGVYRDDFYAGKPALTVKELGQGKAYYLAARVNDPAFYEAFYGKLVQDAGVRRALDAALPAGVTAQLRTDGEREYVFVQNFSGQTARVELDGRSYADAESGAAVAGVLELPVNVSPF